MLRQEVIKTQKEMMKATIMETNMYWHVCTLNKQVRLSLSVSREPIQVLVVVQGHGAQRRPQVMLLSVKGIADADSFHLLWMLPLCEATDDSCVKFRWLTKRNIQIKEAVTEKLIAKKKDCN